VNKKGTRGKKGGLHSQPSNDRRVFNGAGRPEARDYSGKREKVLRTPAKGASRHKKLSETSEKGRKKRQRVLMGQKKKASNHPVTKEGRCNERVFFNGDREGGRPPPSHESGTPNRRLAWAEGQGGNEKKGEGEEMCRSTLLTA